MSAPAPSPGGRAGGDSSGAPWAGRSLGTTPFPGDDGTAPPALAALLGVRASGGQVDVAAVVAALPGLRLLVPVVARATGHDGATTGEVGTEMALPTLRAGDGRAVLPVFSSTAELTAWHPGSRPVPVEARRVALSAVQEGHDLLVLDPAGAAVLVPRPAVWALAQGRPWTPSPGDGEVLAAVRDALAGLDGVRGVRCEPGRAAELRVVLELASGLSPGDLTALTGAAGVALAASEVVAERVDSLELGLVPTSEASPSCAAAPPSARVGHHLR